MLNIKSYQKTYNHYNCTDIIDKEIFHKLIKAGEVVIIICIASEKALIKVTAVSIFQIPNMRSRIITSIYIPLSSCLDVILGIFVRYYYVERHVVFSLNGNTGISSGFEATNISNRFCGINRNRT